MLGLLERVVAIESRLGTTLTNGTAKDDDEDDFDLFGSDEVCGRCCAEWVWLVQVHYRKAWSPRPKRMCLIDSRRNLQV